MNVRPGTVLKKHQVKLAEAPVAAAPAAARAARSPADPAGAARIVRQDDAGALLEIVCPCGQKTYVQCTYKT